MLPGRFKLVYILTLLVLALPPLAPAQSEQDLILNFGGDLTFANHFQKYVKKHYSYPFAKFPEFAAADISMANLETTFTFSDSAQPKMFTFKADPAYVKVLKNGGIDIVTIANNHIYDFGQEGLINTMAYLDSAGIAYVGAGINKQLAHRPVIKNVKGIRIAFLGYYGLKRHSDSHPATDDSAGTALRKLKLIRRDVKALRDSVNLIVVNFHWGLEKEHVPQEEQIYFAHKTIDYGADLIIGHHPHVLQGIERYKNRYIVYSLGNFIFGGNSRTYEQTAVFQARVNLNSRNIEGFSILPLEVRHWQPRLMHGKAAEALVDSLKKYSEALPVSAF